MDYLEVMGGVPLYGEISIQGSKNAVLPILAACLLGEGKITIHNCPSIGDVEDTLEILKGLGCRVEKCGETVTVDGSGVEKYEIEAHTAARIRSSILFLGALLGKMGRAVLPRPGGCAIGARPIDLHLTALRSLGVRFGGTGKITADMDGWRGGIVNLPMPSVGATENLILASVLAEGKTVIVNGAREPEIDELCRFLNLRGASIMRTEDGTLEICGVKRLGPIEYRMQADRIVTGTYLLAAAATEGCIRIRNFPEGQLDALLELLEGMGGRVRKTGRGLLFEMGGRAKAIPRVETQPYPGFPTDLQSPLMAVLCRAQGESRIRETIFENRFRTAEELKKMGARIQVEGDTACIRGIQKLQAADLAAPDLRGGAALVIAALQAVGRTRIFQIEYIARGYEDISRDLCGLGADIRQKTQEPKNFEV